MKIAVAGTGYVGLSMAVLLSQYHQVKAVDVIPEKVDMLNRRISPIADEAIEQYLREKELNLTATVDAVSAYRDADFVIVATPTNYDPLENYFDTSSVESVIRQVEQINPSAFIVIKSTVPIGFTKKISTQLNVKNILFSPEFLRESKALYDNLYPGRIIVGADLSDPQLQEAAKTFSGMLRDAALKEGVPTLLMETAEAEAVKLFANTCLALRVAFFNELDSYAEANGLNAGNLINGICLDPRIGTQYNNPSFGYGGYCLPKDTKLLLSNFGGIPQNIMSAIVEANQTRKDFVTSRILEKLNGIENATVGIYRLAMKSGSDNFRESAILDIIEQLKQHQVRIRIYEPLLKGHTEAFGCPVINDLDEFKKSSSLIVANRFTDCLNDVKQKVYTRDLFQKD